MNATLFASLVVRFVVCSKWAALEIWNIFGAWFLMRRHLEHSKQISISTKEKKTNGRLFYAHICHSQDHIRVDIIYSNIRRWVRSAQHTLSRHQTNVCRRRQRHHPKLTEPTPRMRCCWYLHTCVVHSTFLRFVFSLLFCVFYSALGRLEKKNRGGKREATQTLCLMRYLQMLWRVETMLEICSEFVPFHVASWIRTSTILLSVNSFAGVPSVDAIVATQPSTNRRADFLFTYSLVGFGSKSRPAYLTM